MTPYFKQRRFNEICFNKAFKVNFVFMLSVRHDEHRDSVYF